MGSAGGILTFSLVDGVGVGASQSVLSRRTPKPTVSAKAMIMGVNRARWSAVRIASSRRSINRSSSVRDGCWSIVAFLQEAGGHKQTGQAGFKMTKSEWSWERHAYRWGAVVAGADAGASVCSLLVTGFGFEFQLVVTTR